MFDVAEASFASGIKSVKGAGECTKKYATPFDCFRLHSTASPCRAPFQCGIRSTVWMFVRPSVCLLAGLSAVYSVWHVLSISATHLAVRAVRRHWRSSRVFAQLGYWSCLTALRAPDPGGALDQTRPVADAFLIVRCKLKTSKKELKVQQKCWKTLFRTSCASAPISSSLSHVH